MLITFDTVDLTKKLPNYITDQSGIGRRCSMTTIQTCSLVAVRLELLRVNRWAKRKGASLRDQIGCLSVFAESEGGAA